MNTPRQSGAVALAAAMLTCGPAAAQPGPQGLTLQGQLSGDTAVAGGSLSIGLWAISPTGERLQQVTGAPVTDAGRWTVTVQGSVTGSTLPGNLNWPGVLPPVALSATPAPPRAQEVRAYAFNDPNRNGRVDPGEGGGLHEVSLRSAGKPLFVVWVDTPLTVTAGRGYRAELAAGWNALRLNLGQSISLSPYPASELLDLRVSP